MNLEVWHLWMIAAVVLFIIEIFIPTFVAACIGIGCFIAGIFSVLKFGMDVQLIVFSIGTIATFFAVRPFVLKYLHREKEHVATNVDALIGKRGRVVVAINNEKHEGRAIVEGDDWKAIAKDNEIIEAGKTIEVIEVNSTIIIVKSIN